MNLFEPEAFEQIPGQLSMDDVKRPVTAVRSNRLGGMTAGKWHLVTDSNDHVALCGREHTSIGSFPVRLAAEGLPLAYEHGWICKRCEVKR